MKGPDLSQLHDFCQPPPASWMPQTIGWYVLFTLLLAGAVFSVVQAIRRWLNNRYRRDALHEIELADAAQVSEILKRAAMVRWSRRKVASLTGKDWTDFLADSSGLAAFRSSPGDGIESAAFSNSPPTAADRQRAKELAADWVKLHHV